MLGKAAILHIGLTLAALVTIGAGTAKLASRTIYESPFVLPPQQALSGNARQEYYVREPFAGVAHAATAMELGDGRIVAFWFEGSEEAGSDVSLQSSEFREGQGWSAPREITNGEKTGSDQGRYVRTIGNPVAFRHP